MSLRHHAPPAARPALRSPALAPPSPLVRTGTQTGGQSLDRHTQARMSARFGHDFSSIRIHTDAHAGDSAAAVGANAYAHGSDVVFGEGQYTPGSPETERLLAHELTHVVQQTQYGPGNRNRTSERGDASEREAEALATEVTGGRSVDVQAAPGAAIARDEDAGLRWDPMATAMAKMATPANVAAPANSQQTQQEMAAIHQNPLVAPFAALGMPRDNQELQKRAIHEHPLAAPFGVLGMPAEDSSFLHDAAQFGEGMGAGFGGAVVEGVEGVGEGVEDVVAGLAHMARHPLQTAETLENVVEHTPGIGAPLKMGHGALNLISGRETLGEFAGDLNPINSLTDDFQFDMNAAGSFAAPIVAEAAQGRPVAAATHGLTNVWSALSGVEAGAVDEMASLGGAATGAARAGEEAAGAASELPANEPPSGGGEHSGGGSPEPGNEAHNVARHEAYKRELRQNMGKPAAKHPEMKQAMSDNYRDNAKIGSGSTADAIRHERATGQKVGGRSHTLKGEEQIKRLEKWLDRNPAAPPGDRAAAENVIKDLRDALGH